MSPEPISSAEEEVLTGRKTPVNIPGRGRQKAVWICLAESLDIVRLYQLRHMHGWWVEHVEDVEVWVRVLDFHPGDFSVKKVCSVVKSQTWTSWTVSLMEYWRRLWNNVVSGSEDCTKRKPSSYYDVQRITSSGTLFTFRFESGLMWLVMSASFINDRSRTEGGSNDFSD